MPNIWNPDEYDQYQEEETDSYDSVIEDVYEQPSQNTSAVINAAVKRIEEANLFKMLITSDVFAPGSASPVILEAVNKRIRLFATQQLEELLGMSSPKPTVVSKSDFNAKEVEILKDFVSKIMAKSATTTTRVPELQPITAAEPERKIVTTAPTTPSMVQINTDLKAQQIKQPIKKQPSNQQPKQNPGRPRKIKSGLITNESAFVKPPANSPHYKPMPTGEFALAALPQNQPAGIITGVTEDGQISMATSGDKAFNPLSSLINLNNTGRTGL